MPWAPSAFQVILVRDSLSAPHYDLTGRLPGLLFELFRGCTKEFFGTMGLKGKEAG